MQHSVANNWVCIAGTKTVNFGMGGGDYVVNNNNYTHKTTRSCQQYCVNMCIVCVCVYMYYSMQF